MRQQSRKIQVEQKLTQGRLRRVNPYLHFCWIELRVAAALPRVRASPSVHVAKSRFCTFTSQQNGGGKPGRSKRAAKVDTAYEHNQAPSSNLSLVTIESREPTYPASDQRQSISEKDVRTSSQRRQYRCCSCGKRCPRPFWVPQRDYWRSGDGQVELWCCLQG